jgi:ABC-2 type transport system ATP-binding protein
LGETRSSDYARRKVVNEVVQIRGLRKTYDGLVAVDGLDLSIGSGEIFGLLGHNGAGKTTTIECALGTRKRDGGSVRLLGLDPVKDRKVLFERIGVQFQEMGYQDKIRVGELCVFSAALYAKPRDYRELLDRFGLGGKARKAVSELSGGERQKLSIVLALLPGPELVFLDELTTGLDPKARREMWALIKGLKAEGVTVFMTSHYMEEVEYLCDRVAIMRAGQVVAQGTPADLIALNKAKNLEEAFLLYLDEGEALREEAR